MDIGPPLSSASSSVLLLRDLEVAIGSSAEYFKARIAGHPHPVCPCTFNYFLARSPIRGNTSSS